RRVPRLQAGDETGVQVDDGYGGQVVAVDGVLQVDDLADRGAVVAHPDRDVCRLVRVEREARGGVEAGVVPAPEVACPEPSGVTELVDDLGDQGGSHAGLSFRRGGRGRGGGGMRLWMRRATGMAGAPDA